MKLMSISNGTDTFDIINPNQGREVRQLSGFEFPTVSNVIEDLPSRNGSLFVSSKLRRRRLSIDGGLVTSQMSQTRRDFVKTLQNTSLLDLYFTTNDNLALQTKVAVDRLTMPQNSKTCRVSRYLMELIAPDFRFYDQTLKTAATTVTTIPGGAPVPAAVPAPIAGGSTQSYILNNDGNYNTPPVFLIRGPGTNFIVQNITTGQSFNLNLTLSASQTVRIDTFDKSVIRLTNTNVFGNFDGSFFELVPGQNIIHFNAQTGVTGDTQLTTQWRDSYLGV